jgi:hypothetical protein
MDPAQVHALYVLVASASGPWHRIDSDAPGLQWTVEFKRGGTSLGSYHIGEDFLEVAHYTVQLSPQERQAADRLLWHEPPAAPQPTESADH